MSFANFDLEAQRLPNKVAPNQSLSQNELDAIIHKTSQQLQSFGSLISQFDSQKRLVGSKRDTSQLRGNIDELTRKISDLEGAIQHLVLNLSSLVNKKLNAPKKTPDADDDNEQSENTLQVTNRQIVIKERLVNEFNDLHKQFQTSVKQYNDKKTQYTVKDTVPETERTPLLATENEDSYTQDQVQVQQQEQDQINETELQYHMLLTEERNREINQISEGILEVNSIFKDLGELVNQQGEQLDTIEDNILQLHGNTQQADRELTKAHEYQKSKSKWTCILLVALCIFVLVVVLAVIS